MGRKGQCNGAADQRARGSAWSMVPTRRGGPVNPVSPRSNAARRQ